MAKKTKDSNLSIEERLEQALIPNWDEPYKLPENWCWVRVDAIASIYTGNSINEHVKEEKYTGRTDGLVYLATKDIDFDSTIDYDTNVCIPQSEGFKVAPKYSTLLCIEGGSAGRKIGFITQDVCFVNKLCAFVPHGKINPKYLYYAIQSDAFKKHGLIGGVSVKEVSSIFVPFAPIESQNKIVELIESVFNKLDEASEKAQEVVDGFETRKAAILHKAFSGELTAKWREENDVSFDEWITCSLSKCCKIGSGGTPSRKNSEYYAGDIPWIKTGEIEWNEVVDSEEKISQAAIDNSSAKLYNPGAVLVAMYGMGVTRGRAAILGVKAATNQAVCVLQPQEYLNNRYLFYFFMCNYWSVREQAVGGNQLNLSATIIGKLNIDIPPVSEQMEIVRVLYNLISKEQRAKETAERVIEQVDTMKKAILARAFRGELGTNDPSEESAVELLKKVLGGDVAAQAPAKKPTKRISIPSDIKELLSNIREEEIIKLLLKSAPQPVSIQEIMSLSSKKFELMDALRSLEKKHLITKNESGDYSLTR